MFFSSFLPLTLSPSSVVARCCRVTVTQSMNVLKWGLVVSRPLFFLLLFFVSLHSQSTSSSFFFFPVSLWKFHSSQCEKKEGAYQESPSLPILVSFSLSLVHSIYLSDLSPSSPWCSFNMFRGFHIRWGGLKEREKKTDWVWYEIPFFIQIREHQMWSMRETRGTKCNY